MTTREFASALEALIQDGHSEVSHDVTSNLRSVPLLTGGRVDLGSGNRSLGGKVGIHQGGTQTGPQRGCNKRLEDSVASLCERGNQI